MIVTNTKVVIFASALFLWFSGLCRASTDHLQDAVQQCQLREQEFQRRRTLCGSGVMQFIGASYGLSINTQQLVLMTGDAGIELTDLIRLAESEFGLVLTPRTIRDESQLNHGDVLILHDQHCVAVVQTIPTLLVFDPAQSVVRPLAGLEREGWSGLVLVPQKLGPFRYDATVVCAFCWGTIFATFGLLKLYKDLVRRVTKPPARSRN